MKKLFSLILVLIFLKTSISLSAISPEKEKFVFQKLYDEYLKCTVYYKFLHRATERKGNLNEQDKQFLSKMDKMREDTEINAFFFAEKLKISNEDFNKSYKKIYTFYYEMAGKNYSNIGKLIENLTAPCENSVKNPQLRMVYWDNIYEKNNNSKVSIINKTFLCTDIVSNYVSAYEITNESEALMFRISDWKVKEEKRTYKIDIEEIKFFKDNMKWSSIDRSTLRLNHRNQCKIYSESGKKLISDILQKRIDERNRTNKF